MAVEQRGAGWIAGGELKALHRIMPPVDGEAEADDLPPRSHNRPPMLVFNVSAEDSELESQASAVEKALAESVRADNEAEGKQVCVGRELVRLREIYLSRAAKRHAKIHELRDGGMTFAEISPLVGFTAEQVAYVCRWRNDPKRRLELTREGVQFYEWATSRFGMAKTTLRRYLSFGREGQPEVDRQRTLERRQPGRIARAAARNTALALLRAEETKKVAPTLFKKAFMALQAPVRKATLLWACSAVIGSEDPQEIARWFAAALERR